MYVTVANVKLCHSSLYAAGPHHTVRYVLCLPVANTLVTMVTLLLFVLTGS